MQFLHSCTSCIHKLISFYLSFVPQVVTEGRLILEFSFDDLMRIRNWHFAIRQHRELIPRSVVAMQMGGGTAPQGPGNGIEVSIKCHPALK